MLSADGCVDVVVPEETGCCPPPLCGNDLCCTFVAFFNLLPTGPLWDYWKTAAISYFQRDDAKPEECPLITDPRCPSLVLHAIYTVLKLKLMVHDALWPAFREGNPYTAVTTLDDHLLRLQWEDCYNQHCRSPVLGSLTPLEVMTVCGPLLCPPDYPPELEVALKRAIAIALTRANMGVIKNLCGLNWVIESLGVELVPIYLPPPGEPPPDCVDPPDPVPLFPEQTLPCEDVEDAPCYAEPTADCDPHDCGNTAFELRPIQDWIYGVGSGDVCETQLPLPHVPASWDWGCDKPAGLPDTVWPGMLAAECIVRSMLHCPTDIRRIC